MLQKVQKELSQHELQAPYEEAESNSHSTVIEHRKDNLLRMGLELQYDGLQRGYELGYPDFNSPASILAEDTKI